MRIILHLCLVCYCLLLDVFVSAQTNNNQPPPPHQRHWDSNPQGQNWNKPPHDRPPPHSHPQWNNGPPPDHNSWQNQQPPPPSSHQQWNGPPPPSNQQWNGPPPQSHQQWNPPPPTPPPPQSNWSPPSHNQGHNPHHHGSHPSHQQPPYNPNHHNYPPPPHYNYPPNHHNHPPPPHNQNHNPHNHHNPPSNQNHHPNSPPHQPPWHNQHQPHSSHQSPPWNNQPSGHSPWNNAPPPHQQHWNTPPPASQSQQSWSTPTTPLYPEWNSQTQSPWEQQNNQQWQDPNQNSNSKSWSSSTQNNNHQGGRQNPHQSPWQNPSTPPQQWGPPPQNQVDPQQTSPSYHQIPPPYPHTPPPHQGSPPYPHTQSPYHGPITSPQPPWDSTSAPHHNNNWNPKQHPQQAHPPPPPQWHRPHAPPPPPRHRGEWGHHHQQSRHSGGHRGPQSQPHPPWNPPNYPPHRSNQPHHHQQHRQPPPPSGPYHHHDNYSMSYSESPSSVPQTTMPSTSTGTTPETIVQNHLAPMTSSVPDLSQTNVKSNISISGSTPAPGPTVSQAYSEMSVISSDKNGSYSTVMENPPYKSIDTSVPYQVYDQASNNRSDHRTTTKYPYFPWKQGTPGNDKAKRQPPANKPQGQFHHNRHHNNRPHGPPSIPNRGPPHHVPNSRPRSNPYHSQFRSQGPGMPPSKRLWPDFSKPLHNAPWMKQTQTNTFHQQKPPARSRPQVAPAVQSGPPDPNAGPGPQVVPAKQGKKLAEPLITPSYMNYGVNHPDGMSTEEEFQLIASRVQRLISYKPSGVLKISDYLTMDRNRQTFALRSRGIRDLCYVGILDEDIIAAFREVVNKTKAVEFPFIEANTKLFFYKELEQIFYSDALREAGSFVADSCGKDAFIFRVVRVNHGVIKDGNKTIPGDACPFGPPLRDNPWSVTQCSNKRCPVQYKCNHMYNVCCPDMPATTNCVSLSLGQICITYLPSRVIID